MSSQVHREIRLAIEGPLARISIDRPPLNVLTTTMLRDLADRLEQASAAAEVRLILLDAKGKAFCAGVDVSDHIGLKVESMIDALARLFDTFDRIAEPTIASVHGMALGGGCELVLAADLCLASERASFGQPEIRLGLFAPLASVLLPRLVGERRALEILLGGETISARRAESIGLVNRVYPDEEFEAEVEKFVARLLAHSAVALRQAKRAVRLSRDRSVEDGHREVNRQYIEELMSSKDAHEGLAAFIEKRPATWQHR